jgi:hypothetical protein
VGDFSFKELGKIQTAKNCRKNRKNSDSKKIEKKQIRKMRKK